MYSRSEKSGRLMMAISSSDYFVMAGSMDSFNTPFVPLFELAVHIDAPADIRRKRIHQRELERYGRRILEGGNMAEGHLQFLKDSDRYETDGSPNRKRHLEWAASLPCPVLLLNGERPLQENMQLILDAYRKL